MKKLLAICTVVLCLVGFVSAQSEFSGIVNKYYEKLLSPEGRSYNSWKEGCKVLKLDLQKIVFTADIVEEVTIQGSVFVRVILELRGLCLDSAGLRKSVVTIRQVALHIENNMVIRGVFLGEMKEPTVVDGWDSKDI